MEPEDLARRMINEPRMVTEDTARRLVDALDKKGAFVPVRRLRGSQAATAVLGSVGAALLFGGVQNAAASLPFVSHSWGSILAGLALLAITGGLLSRLIAESR
jgi:hypothetical protein